jgi:hypothetical protein
MAHIKFFDGNKYFTPRRYRVEEMILGDRYDYNMQTCQRHRLIYLLAVTASIAAITYFGYVLSTGFPPNGTQLLGSILLGSLFTAGWLPYILFKILIRKGIVVPKDPQSPATAISYDNDAAAETIAAHLATNGVAGYDKRQIANLLSERDTLVDGAGGGTDPQSALFEVVKAHGIDRATASLIDAGEESYLKQIGLIQS